MKETKTARMLVALIWWTLAGTVMAVVGIWATIPTGIGLLWPAAIHPHWLGAAIGGVAFIVLTGILQGRQEKARAEQRKPRRKTTTELTAARADVAHALRARIAQQAQRLE